MGFANEARLTASLGGCRNVLRVWGLVVRPPQLAVVTELCARGELPAAIGLARAAGVWRDDAPAPKLRVGCDCARALAHVHARGVIHRDVKPPNFLVADDWTVKLADFGEATEYEVRDDDDDDAVKRDAGGGSGAAEESEADAEESFVGASDGTFQIRGPFRVTSLGGGSGAHGRPCRRRG